MTETSRPHSYVLTARLDAEWNRLRRDPRSAATVRSWAHEPDVPAEVAELFAGVEELRQLMAATHAGRSLPSADEVLLALITLAPRHPLAGRVLVQRLFPTVVPGAMRYGWMAGGDDPIEVAIGALWISIRMFDTVRRRHHVASMLISDTMHVAFRKRARQRSASERTTAPDVFVDLTVEPRLEPLVELAAVVADAKRAGVPDDDLELLCHLVRVESPDVVALERQVTARTVRNHRRRAVERVREAVAIGA